MRKRRVVVLAFVISAAVIGAVVSRLSSHRIFQWTIPPESIKAENGHAFSTGIPERFRRSRWYECGVQILEDGIPLRLRCDTNGAVERLGDGRLFVPPFANSSEEQFVLFSSSDGTDPRRNEKKYDVVVSVPSAISSMLGVEISAELCIVGGSLLLVPAIFFLLAGPGRTAEKIRLFVAWLACVIAVVVLSSKATINLGIDRSRLEYSDKDNHYTLRLGGLLRRLHFVETPRLTVDGISLGWIPRGLWPDEETLSAGVFTHEEGRPVKVHLCLPAGVGDNDVMLTIRPYPAFARKLLFWAAIVILPSLGLVIRCIGYSAQAARVGTLTRSCLGNFSAIAMVSVSCLRLWLVSEREVVAMTADQLSYAQWSAKLWETFPVHPVGPSLLAAIPRFLGIPWRLFIEIAFIGGCFFLAKKLKQLMNLAMLTEVLIFTSLIFLPNSFLLFDWFNSECGMLVMLAVFAGLLVGHFRSRDSFDVAGLFGICCCFGFWSVQRLELPLAVAVFFSIAAAKCVSWRVYGFPQIRFFFCWLLFPLCSMIVPSETLRCYHWYLGYPYAVCGIESPGLMALMGSLYKIDTSEKIKYAAVTKEALRQACEVSPIMESVRDVILNPSNPETLIGQALVGRPGEPGPWLNWLLPSGFSSVYADSSEQMMKAASGQIETAFENKRLRKRLAVFPIDPNAELWLSDVGPAVVKAALAGAAQSYTNSGAHLRSKSRSQIAVFDKALLRRNWLVQSGEKIVALTFDKPGAVDTVIVRSVSGLITGCGSADEGGEVECVVSESSGPLLFQFVDTAGEKIVGSLRLQLFDGVVHQGVAQIAAQNVGYSVKLTELSQSLGVGPPLRGSLRAAWLCLWIGGVVMCLLSGLRYRGDTLPIKLALVTLVATVVLRACLFGLMEAMLLWNSDRYMSIVGPITVSCSCLFSFVLGNCACRLVRGVVFGKA